MSQDLLQMAFASLSNLLWDFGETRIRKVTILHPERAHWSCEIQFTTAEGSFAITVCAGSTPTKALWDAVQKTRARLENET